MVQFSAPQKTLDGELLLALHVLTYSTMYVL